MKPFAVVEESNGVTTLIVGDQQTQEAFDGGEGSLSDIATAINADLERREAKLRGPLTALSRRVESVIASGSWSLSPDHACRECMPNGESLVDGFRCSRHAAFGRSRSEPARLRPRRPARRRRGESEGATSRTRSPRPP